MAKKGTLRFIMNNQIATVSFHKNFYKLEIGGLYENFVGKTHYFPKSITNITKFDEDNSNNQ